MTPRNQQIPPADPSSASSQGADSDFMRDTAFVPAQIGEDATEGAGGSAESAPLPEYFPPELVAQALDPTLRALFHIIATQRGAHWELKTFEAEGLVKGWTPLVQLLLARLGSHEQGMLALALMATMAVVGGKAAQDAMLGASLTASTKTPGSGASSVSSASAAAAKPPEPNSSSWAQSE